MSQPNYRAAARRAAKRYGISPKIFVRQINQESGFADDVIHGRRASSAGAQGIAQIMPETARGWGVDPLKPKQALDAAAKNMRRYLDSYDGDWKKALAAYNAGPGAVQKYNGVPPYAETQNYVAAILGDSNPTAPLGTPKANRSDDRTKLVSTTTPGVDNSKARAGLITDYFLGGGDREQGSYRDLVFGLGAATDTAPKTVIESVKVPGQTDAGRGNTTQPASKTSLTPGGGWGGSTGMLKPFDSAAKDIGMAFSGKRAGVPSGSSTGSDHHTSQKLADARDYTGSEEQMRKLSQRIARTLGAKHTYGGADLNVTKTVDGHSYRFQLITRPHGTGPHVHLGVRRVS